MTTTLMIPARYAATRLPGKLLLEETGKPLLQYTYERAKLSKADTIIIATDDERIKTVSEAFGARVIMTTTAHESGTARIAQALEILTAEDGEAPQIIINLQGDEPEIDPENINRLIHLHTAYKDVFFASTLACPFAPTPETGPGSPMDPACVKLVATPMRQGEIGREEKEGAVAASSAGYLTSRSSVNRQHFTPHSPVDPAMPPDGPPDGPFEARYFSRAPIPYCRDQHGMAAAPATYLLHLGLYAFSPESLALFPQLRKSALEEIEKLEQLRILDNGYRIGVGLVDTNAPGIDTREDYEAFMVRAQQGSTL